MNETKALLRLFNAVKVDITEPMYLYNESIWERTVRNGYVLDGSIATTAGLLDTIDSVIGITGEKINQSFHKSWSVVKDTPIELLLIQQLIHYFTTYGFEALGIDSDYVYVPSERLEVPEISGDIPLVIVRGMNVQDIFVRLQTLVTSGIALSEQTIEDIMTIVRANEFPQGFVYTVANKELRTKLYDYYGVLPQEPVEFLRYVVNKLTGRSLLIKDKATIGMIKMTDGRQLDVLMAQAPKNLASIFYRFKPIFLAMKSISNDKTFYNRLRKQAVRMHKPMKESYLNTVTERIKNGELSLHKLIQELGGANTFRKIRLAYALQYRLSPSDSIVYQVRNGKNWVDDFEWNQYDLHNKTHSALHVVLQSIAEDLREKVDGVKVVVPENIFYALPATEKQFTGNYPSGTYIGIPSEDLVIGVYWENLDDKRIDLDLSMLNVSGKLGWDGRYRGRYNDNSILFSGDVTDARNGASELFYYSNGVSQTSLLELNYYNFDMGEPVDFKLVIGSEHVGNFKNNYMLNPNNIVSTIPMTLDEKQRSLGVVMNVGNEVRFYFSNGSMGNNITSTVSDVTKKALGFYNSKLLNSIDMASVLEMAGAEIVHEVPEDDDEVYIDLVNLDKVSLIELLS